MMGACHWKEENKRHPSKSSVRSNESNVLNCVPKYREKLCRVENSPFYGILITAIIWTKASNQHKLDKDPNWREGDQGILRASRELNVGQPRKKSSHNFSSSLLLSFFLFVDYKWAKYPSSTSSPTCTSISWISRAQWRCIYRLRGRVWGEIFGSRWWSIERALRWPKGQMFSQPALRLHTSAVILVF